MRRSAILASSLAEPTLPLHDDLFIQLGCAISDGHLSDADHFSAAPADHQRLLGRPPRLFQYSVERGLETHSVFWITRSHPRSVVSCFCLPDAFPGVMFLECASPPDLGPDAGLIGPASHLECFCFSQVRPGASVRVLSRGAFEGDAGDVAEVDFDRWRVLVKLVPRIDYDGLLHDGLASQDVLSQRRSPAYRPPLAPFDVAALGGATPTDIAINGRTTPAHRWDGGIYVGAFRYQWFPLQDVAPLKRRATAAARFVAPGNIPHERKVVSREPDVPIAMRTRTKEKRKRPSPEVHAPEAEMEDDIPVVMVRFDVDVNCFVPKQWRKLLPIQRKPSGLF
jgi:hypothetical protein